MHIQIENGFLEYDTVGQGLPVLFIHGYPLSRRIWEPQLEGLSDQAMMITVDLRGHGESFPFEGRYTMDLLAEDLQKILAAANIKTPVVVCGLSMGGYATMALYRQNPRLFKGMILTSTRPGADSPEGKASRQASIVDALENGAGYIADGMIEKIVSPATRMTKPELVKTIHGIMAKTSVQGIVGALQGMMERPDSTQTLGMVNCPVLIIHGLDDQLIAVKEAEAMHRVIPDSRLVKIPQAGHLCNMEQPELFNQAIREFISPMVQV